MRVYDVNASLLLKIADKECETKICASVTEYDSGKQTVEFKYVAIDYSNFDTKFYHGQTLITHKLTAENFDRCIFAVQNQIRLNKSLFSSAHEMLEALEFCYEKLQSTGTPMLKQIENIIKKAKGETL